MAKRILLLIAESGILKFMRSPRGYFKIISGDRKQWSGIHRKTVLYAIKLLYKRGLVNIREGPDGATTIAINPAGREAAAAALEAKPEKWDGKWRLILFDIPEAKKKNREAFRYHLRRIGFAEFKRSALIFPYPCSSEIHALAKELDLSDHIALVTAEAISEELKFKRHFGLA